MDRRERVADAVEQFRSGFEGLQSEMYTALPGVIDSVNFDELSCTVQPGIMAQVTALDGTTSWVELPLLLDCPIVFPGGGGFTLTFPVEQGDEALVVFSSRCIDNWFAQKGETGASGLSRSQAELRMHDLSDGYVLVGVRNKTRASLLEASNADTQLRTDAGTAVISIRANSEVYIHSDVNVIVDADGDVSVQAGGDVNVTAGGDAVINATGAVDVTAASMLATIAGAATVTAETAVLTATVVAAVTAPSIQLTGAVNVIGSLLLNGVPFGLTHIHTGGTLTGGHTGPVV